MNKPILAMLTAAGLTLAACGGGGGETEFIAMDAEGLAQIVDAGLTADSGLRGLITADTFSPDDIAEFNALAEEACTELQDGISAAEYDDFQAGVAEGAAGMEDLIDADALVVAMIDATCPSYVDSLEQAIAG